MDRDKADTVGNGFNTSGIAADLQHIAFIEHHVIVDRHFNLAADHAVEETTVVGQLQLCQTAAHGVVVFHHNLFGDDTHVQQVAVKHLFPVAEARIETRVGVRVANKGDVIAHLEHRVTVRVCQNAVTTDTFDVAAGLTVDPQLAQVFPVGPGNQLRPDAVGADHRQVNFTFGVRVQAALAGDGLGAGLEILMLKFWQIARANNQAHQTNQIGQGIAQTQVVQRGGKLRACHARMTKRIPRANKHRRGGHRACQHTGR